MIKAILLILVAGCSVNVICKAIARKATGPYTKEIELLWAGETCGSFGKIIVIMVPFILLALINKIL